jgi:hypothetical protein
MLFSVASLLAFSDYHADFAIFYLVTVKFLADTQYLIPQLLSSTSFLVCYRSYRVLSGAFLGPPFQQWLSFGVNWRLEHGFLERAATFFTCGFNLGGSHRPAKHLDHCYRAGFLFRRDSL